jgi:hypothetical protein
LGRGATLIFPINIFCFWKTLHGRKLKQIAHLVTVQNLSDNLAVKRKKTGAMPDIPQAQRNTHKARSAGPNIERIVSFIGFSCLSIMQCLVANRFRQRCRLFNSH